MNDIFKAVSNGRDLDILENKEAIVSNSQVTTPGDPATVVNDSKEDNGDGVTVIIIDNDDVSVQNDTATTGITKP